MYQLSIITINYNNAIGLQKTIKSVINQSFKDIEYIIIDGGSTDGSVDVIKKHEKYIDYWISEPDNGIYNAMNKGILVANGEYLLMLNSGDYLISKNILNQAFFKKWESDIIYGDVLWHYNGKIFESDFNEKLTFQFFRNNAICHQSTFIRKSLHNLIGLYDENCEIVSDWKFILLAICKYNISYKRISLVISVCGCDGISWNRENWDKVFYERNDIFRKVFPAYIPDHIEMESSKNKLNAIKGNLLYKVKKKLSKLFNANH